MNDSDRPHFAKIMARVFRTYNDELTPGLLDDWWCVMERFELRDVADAMNLHLQDPQRGVYRPLPANVIENLNKIMAQRAQAVADDRGRARLLMLAQEERLYRIEADERLGLIDAAKAAAMRAEVHQAMRELRADPEYLRLTHGRP